MKDTTKPVRKERKAKRRGGVLRGCKRITKGITALVLAIACAAFAFTQLGFVGLGWNGEYSAYLVAELVPVAVAALLLGPLVGLCMGAFAGAMLLVHATFMPLNFYELTFVTPLTSVVMLGVTGWILGCLFKFALRNDPSLLRGSIYIVIICVIVSWLYSIGFLVNAIISMVYDLAIRAQHLSYEQTSQLTNEKLSSMILRMGHLGLQAWGDAALMSLFCIVANIVASKAKTGKFDYGLRSMFAVRLSIVVVVAFMVVSILSFASITQSKLNDAADRMDGELSYLQSQIANVGKRTDSLVTILDSMHVEAAMVDDELLKALETYSMDGILDGYSVDGDGSILVLKSAENLRELGIEVDDGYVVLAGDDSRFEKGTVLNSMESNDVIAAMERSLATGNIERAIYDQDYGKSVSTLIEEGVDRIRSEIVYVRASSDDNGTILMVMLTARQVFAERFGVMLWTALSVFLLLAAVFAMVFLLLDRVIARRIDETNGVLARITEGNLNATVDTRNPREFASLANGVNETVGTLKGWIAEAESRMDAELAAAKAIQTSALPSVFPPFPDIRRFDVFASMNAAREVGGDFYDFFLIGDDCDAASGKLGFIIADVSGKGVPAALFMMKSMTQLRDYLKAGVEVGEAVENTNRQLCEGNDGGMFVTLWAGVLDYPTNHVDFVNAGHNPPLLWQGDSGWRWLTEKSGLPLGLFDGLPYDTYSVECSIGDQFLLYTDGVTEAMSVSGELFGEERLKAFADGQFTEHPYMLVDGLRHEVARWAEGAEQSDDITILALEVGVPPELTAVLKVPAAVENLPRVNDYIHSELDRRLCPKRVQSQLDIAVEELFVNVCHYAYPDATPENPGTVRILRTYSAEPPSVVVDIVDEGIPYNPLAKPDAVTPDDIEEVPIGGLGILMAKRCTDEMRYERSGGRNIVTIVKKW